MLFKVLINKHTYVIAIALLIISCNQSTQKKQVNNEDGLPNIKLAFRNDSIIRDINFEGDNWHTTWAADGNQYVLQCDGQGYNTKLWKLTGHPPDFKFEEVESHPGPKEKPHERYYGFGILGIDSSIYHYFSTPDKWYTNPPWNFIGTKIIYSPDMGKIWKNQDATSPVLFEETSARNQKNMMFFREPDNAFSLLTMLQMGKGYEDNKDGYVYLYSPNGGTEGTMNQLVLCRIKKDSLLHRNAYEFFVSSGGHQAPVWSKRIEDRKPIYTFPRGYVNKLKHPYSWHPSVVYNKQIDLYMMANWGVGVDTSGVWFTKPTYLGVWISKKPWGPWKQIHEDSNWFPPGGTPEGQCYQPQIMPGWISHDGKSFWLSWTQYPKGYYFQVQRVDILDQ